MKCNVSGYGGPGQKYRDYRAYEVYAISSKFRKFPINIRVVVAREAYKEGWLQGPSAVVALPAAGLVNTGPYRGTTL
jgi:hypothetical protein